jgi:hypothetical protein
VSNVLIYGGWGASEHVQGTPCVESSDDACDSYHRYRDGIVLMAGLGLDPFRFSISGRRLLVMMSAAWAGCPRQTAPDRWTWAVERTNGIPAEGDAPSADDLLMAGRAGRRLIWLSVLDAVLATVAAANLTLIYLLYVLGQPGSNFAGFVPITAIGAAPFLITAGLVAWAIRGNGPPGQPNRQMVSRLRIVSGCGLPLMILGGLWSGLAAALLGLEQGTAAAAALTLYQFTFLAAVFVDTVTMIVALRTSTAPRA